MHIACSAVAHAHAINLEIVTLAKIQLARCSPTRLQKVEVCVCLLESKTNPHVQNEILCYFMLSPLVLGSFYSSEQTDNCFYANQRRNAKDGRLYYKEISFATLLNEDLNIRWLHLAKNLA